MAHETRTSEQGDVFYVPAVRDFLLRALDHDIVVDHVHELLFEHVMESKYHPSVIAENLKPMINEVLGVATFEDWTWVAQALTADACEALGVEHPLDRTPGTGNQRSAPKDTDALDVDVNPSYAFVKYVSRDDALVLREKIEVSKILDTRRRAAIILASNVGVTAAQLAALHEMDVLEVWKIIAEFNERGVASVGDFPQ
jgi:hypothetical protein